MVGDTAGLMPCARERMNEWRESLVVTLERRMKSVLDSGDRDMSRRWTMWRGNLRTGLERSRRPPLLFHPLSACVLVLADAPAVEHCFSPPVAPPA